MSSEPEFRAQLQQLSASLDQMAKSPAVEGLGGDLGKLVRAQFNVSATTLKAIVTLMDRLDTTDALITDLMAKMDRRR